MNETTEQIDTKPEEIIVAEWPLWRATLRELRKLPNFGFGMIVDIGWFESRMGCNRHSDEFGFGLLEIRKAVENTEGYYIQTRTIMDDETGIRREVAQIPCAADHDDVAHSFEIKLRNYAHRAVKLRDKTLQNPKAVLSIEERQKMEKSMEIAATRTVLLRRERSIADALRKAAPKLLEN